MKRNLVPKFIQDNINNSNGTINAYIISCDICNFTPLLEKLLKKGKPGAEYTGKLLNETFGAITDIVYLNNGFITNFAGDAYTAIFPECKNINTILNICQAMLNVFNDSNKKHNEKILTVRMGLAYGPIEWGILKGSKSAYFFKGMGINDAVLTQQNAKHDSICINHSLMKIVKKAKIELIKHNSIYVLKNSLQKIESLNCNVKTSSISKKFNNQFFPEILNDLSASGEFRKIVPLFFNFSLDLPSDKVKELVERITYYCNEMNGYFNKIDFTDKGGIILVIFGAPFASENMIENALLLAIKINEEFPDFNITSGLDYGITYTGFIGSKYWQEYTVLGDIVNTAARIACLKSKSINVTNRIKDETSSYEFKFENKLKLKGKNKSIDIHSIISQKSKELEYFSPFVSRDNEQNRVLSILKNSMKKGKTAVIYIEGESGIGKTRLIYHVLKKSGIKLHYGQSDSVLLEPLFPIKQIFASIIGFNQYDKREKKISIIDKYIIKYFPEKSETFLSYTHNLFAISDENILRHISAKEIQETTFYILREIITESAKRTPFVLIFDDMMWTDEDSIEFVNYAFQDNIPGIGIITIFREENKIIKKLNLKHNKINLTNFSYEGVKEFIKAFFNKKPSESLLKLLWDKSEGNPLFLEQITIHLTNNKLLHESGKEITLLEKEYDLPSNIDRLIVSRLDSLSAITREGIKKASVFGKEFEILLLQLLIGKKTKKVLSEGEKNKIISVISKNLGIFRHTLLYEIAYKMQFENELKKLHKKIANIYEQYYHDDLTPYYEILYYHYKNAGIKKKTLYYLELAINRYIGNYSNDIAIKLINEFLSMKISIKNRIKALIKLGNIHMHTAEYKKAIKNLKLAIKENTIDKTLNAEAYKGLGEINCSLGKYSLALKNYNNAFTVFKEKKIMSGMSKVHELKGLVYYYKGDYDIAYTEFNNALKYVDKDKKLKNSIYSNIGLVLYRQGENDKAMKYYKRALKDAEKSNDLNSQSKLHLRIALIFSNKDNMEKSLHHNNISLRLNRKIGNRRDEAIVLGNMGQAYSVMGNKEKTLDFYFKALEIDKDINNLENETIVLGNIANFYAIENQYSKSLKFYKEALKIDIQIGNKWSEAIDLGNMAELYKLQKKNKEADKYFAKCIRIIRRMKAIYPLSHFLSKRAELKLIMEDKQAAIRFAKEAKSIAKQIEKQNLCDVCDKILSDAYKS